MVKYRASAAERSEIRREAVCPPSSQQVMPCPAPTHLGFHSKSSFESFSFTQTGQCKITGKFCKNQKYYDYRIASGEQ